MNITTSIRYLTVIDKYIIFNDCCFNLTKNYPGYRIRQRIRLYPLGPNQPTKPDRIPSCGPTFRSLVLESDSILVSDFDGTYRRFRPTSKIGPRHLSVKLLISSRGRSKPTDRFRRSPALGSYRIPTLGIWMSVRTPDSDRIFMKSRQIPIGANCRIESLRVPSKAKKALLIQ